MDVTAQLATEASTGRAAEVDLLRVLTAQQIPTEPQRLLTKQAVLSEVCAAAKEEKRATDALSQRRSESTATARRQSRVAARAGGNSISAAVRMDSLGLRGRQRGGIVVLEAEVRPESHVDSRTQQRMDKSKKAQTGGTMQAMPTASD